MEGELHAEVVRCRGLGAGVIRVSRRECLAVNGNEEKMMKKRESERSPHQLWAEFRFGLIGALLSKPPEPGELRSRLKELSEQQWQHPIRGEKFTVSLPTIERWYYQSLKHDKDPVGALRRKLRADSGTTRHLTPEIKNWLQNNYRDHLSWSG